MPVQATNTSASHGFAAGLGDRIGFSLQAGKLPGLHSLVVKRHGHMVFEHYQAGEDAEWGVPLGMVQHGPDTLHDVRSVSKSIVSLLYGIALQQCKVPPPEAALAEQFPAYADLAGDPARARLTIAHALTMSLGTEWNEELPYTDPANSEIQMENAPDLLRFVLDRPILQEPGTCWVYNGGTSALLGALIEKGTGMPLADYARAKLFAPLGITQFHWAVGHTGRHSAASGLRLTARGLALVGDMVLQGGLGIVPEAWIRESTMPRLPTGEGPSYGYQWWLGAAHVKAMGDQPQPWIAAFGNGGQRLFISPSTGIVMAACFGNYDQPDNWIYPHHIWWDLVLPSLERM